LEHCVAIADCYHVTLDTLVRRPAEDLLRETDEETKALFGVVTVQEDNTIELPETARELFSLAPGDELLVVGDRRKGMAMVKINGTADFFRDTATTRKETSSCNTNTST
jgi:bifunctional DNA-binding transcriptional regulator/antitoxin component of YhaV-PrlF toxin-antitoxin module